jgi:hypothetical protein
MGKALWFPARNSNVGLVYARAVSMPAFARSIMASAARSRGLFFFASARAWSSVSGVAACAYKHGTVKRATSRKSVSNRTSCVKQTQCQFKNHGFLRSLKDFRLIWYRLQAAFVPFGTHERRTFTKPGERALTLHQDDKPGIIVERWLQL